jgi:hypothetical protein
MVVDGGRTRHVWVLGLLDLQVELGLVRQPESKVGRLIGITTHADEQTTSERERESSTSERAQCDPESQVITNRQEDVSALYV